MSRRNANGLLLKVLGTLNEAQARWYVGREALALGRGGLKTMHELTGMSRPTILKGMRELQDERELSSGRVRQSGGGRKRLEEPDPKLESALERIMDENTAGDPMSLLRWTHKSTRQIAEQLTRQGHATSDETVRRRLGELGYSLQGNVKTKDGSSPIGRDEQFRYINAQVKKFLGRGEPVLSVDTKKKERVGNFKNAGKNWLPQGQPLEVNIYDYPQLGIGTAIPY
ncbi:MAG: ISAzo13 family transposase, partial [Blastocatellia bacterium]